MGPEQRKKMFTVFDESGIFLATCHHQFVLVGCDMVRSGELSVSFVMLTCIFVYFTNLF